MQCFEDLRQGVEIIEASSGTLAAGRRDRCVESHCGTPAVSPTYCFYEVNMFSSYGFSLDFFKKSNSISFMKT